VDDPTYQAKAHVLNQAIQEILGEISGHLQISLTFLTFLNFHQWYLFMVAGFGWIACVVLQAPV